MATRTLKVENVCFEVNKQALIHTLHQKILTFLLLLTEGAATSLPRSETQEEVTVGAFAAFMQQIQGHSAKALTDSPSVSLML